VDGPPSAGLVAVAPLAVEGFVAGVQLLDDLGTVDVEGHRVPTLSELNCASPFLSMSLLLPTSYSVVPAPVLMVTDDVTTAVTVPLRSKPRPGAVMSLLGLLGAG
jgi:hypothetical protein